MEQQITVWQGIFYTWIIISGAIGSLIQFCSCDIEWGSITTFTPVYATIKTWKKLDGVVNTAGKIICSVVVQIAILPSTIVLTVILLFVVIGFYIWDGFVYLFKPKTKNHKTRSDKSRR